jgi:ATP-dependent Clp protease ATP-binding subunit ClpB
MKRHIQRNIETLIARRILETPDIMGKTLIVDAKDGEYIVTIKQASAMA